MMESGIVFRVFFGINLVCDLSKKKKKKFCSFDFLAHIPRPEIFCMWTLSYTHWHWQQALVFTAFIFDSVMCNETIIGQWEPDQHLTGLETFETCNVRWYENYDTSTQKHFETLEAFIKIS